MKPGLLDIINNYAKTWALLQGYDSDKLADLQGTCEERFVLDYDEAKHSISEIKKDLMVKGDATELFGNEKEGGGSLKEHCSISIKPLARR